MSDIQHDAYEQNENPIEKYFVEQAEYLESDVFDELHAQHPNEDLIIRKLTSGGAKLLVGPRGCGKTTLMLKAYNSAILDPDRGTIPVYVNFKFSLKLEPLYSAEANASYWFKVWLNIRVIQGLIETLEKLDIDIKGIEYLPRKESLTKIISSMEAGDISSSRDAQDFSIDRLSNLIVSVLDHLGYSRCAILMDDAAHAFSQRQQEDFFDFFREIKRKEIAPKAAIYPGITIHSHSFQVGHDAEQIDVWIKPEGEQYEAFMLDLARKRFSGDMPKCLTRDNDTIPLLAYSSFGIPRSFLNMLREVYENEEAFTTSDGGANRTKILTLSRSARDAAFNVYNALEFKLPIYKNFVSSGAEIFNKMISTLKDINRLRSLKDQTLVVGIRRSQSHELEKVLSFLQYAGLILPQGPSSRGDKGVFDLYLLHYGALISDNAIIGQRSKSIPLFVEVFRSRNVQGWPRISPEKLLDFGDDKKAFALSLAACPRCGTERLNEHSKFCHNCGSQLKSESLYRELVQQDITALPISHRIAVRIKKESKIRKISDILGDFDRNMLRSVKFIGPVRAARIYNAAEEYVA